MSYQTPTLFPYFQPFNKGINNMNEKKGMSFRVRNYKNIKLSHFHPTEGSFVKKMRFRSGEAGGEAATPAPSTHRKRGSFRT